MPKPFRRIVVLDSVMFYPEHRLILQTLSDDIQEYPSSLPESLERQYTEQPELFRNTQCYTQLGANNTPLQLLMNRIAGADVVISCWTNIPDELLRANPQLRIILFWTHEKEHRVNLTLAKELGIEVRNVPDYGTDAVAEVVFAGLLELWQHTKPFTGIPNAGQLAFGILLDVFRGIRLLLENEKNTRSGKFTHHFHKLGKVDVSFSKKTVEDLIPERLLENKTIALWGFDSVQEQAIGKILDIFQVRTYPLSPQTPFTDAIAHKALSLAERVYVNTARVRTNELALAKQLYPATSFITVNELSYTSERFTGKRFGVIGAGRIGSQVARFASALDAEVVYASPHINNMLEEELHATRVDLPTLCRTSDVLSLHVPAHTADGLLTAHLIDQIKPGSYFINTADGNLIDPAALTKRMERNELFAFLDVYAGLPRKDTLGLPMQDPTDWKLKHALPNHLLTYRSGWKTQESIRVKTYKTLAHLIELAHFT